MTDPRDERILQLEDALNNTDSARAAAEQHLDPSGAAGRVLAQLGNTSMALGDAEHRIRQLEADLAEARRWARDLWNNDTSSPSLDEPVIHPDAEVAPAWLTAPDTAERPGE